MKQRITLKMHIWFKNGRGEPNKAQDDLSSGDVYPGETV